MSNICSLAGYGYPDVVGEMDNQEKPGFFAANLPFLMRQKPGFWALLRIRQQHLSIRNPYLPDFNPEYTEVEKDVTGNS